MNKLMKLFWFISVLIFLVVFLYIYAYVPENVGVKADAYGMLNDFIERGTFFYLGLGIFIMTNAILFTMTKLLPYAKLRKNPAEAVKLNNDLRAWFFGFGTALNIFFTLSTMFIGVINNESRVEIYRYWLLVYTGPALIGVALIFLIFILAGKRKVTE